MEAHRKVRKSLSLCTSQKNKSHLLYYFVSKALFSAHHHHHQSCLRRVWHKSQTKGLHSGLFLTSCISAQLFQPNSFLSFSAILRHVSFGLPLFLLPGGVQLIAILLSFDGSLHITWPIHSHLLALIMLLADTISARL